MNKKRFLPSPLVFVLTISLLLAAFIVVYTSQLSLMWRYPNTQTLLNSKSNISTYECGRGHSYRTYIGWKFSVESNYDNHVSYDKARSWYESHGWDHFNGGKGGGGHLYQAISRTSFGELGAIGKVYFVGEPFASEILSYRTIYLCPPLLVGNIMSR